MKYIFFALQQGLDIVHCNWHIGTLANWLVDLLNLSQSSDQPIPAKAGKQAAEIESFDSFIQMKI
jgi:hypothetical protein